MLENCTTENATQSLILATCKISEMFQSSANKTFEIKNTDPNHNRNSSINRKSQKNKPDKQWFGPLCRSARLKYNQARKKIYH